MNDASFQPTVRLAEISVGRMRSCKLGDREIVLCHTRDGVFALDNICTHAHARMSEGFMRGTRVTCPLHGAVFDVRDGRVLGGPTTIPIGTHPTRVIDGVVEVALTLAERA
ncbi:MAG TPA: non-heme iron oxygenase ferredoxin subunit [Steroidobacteraceae bacterium]|nr:non-heme iron oxygenase ferredoxin subunit [Steroidobacteraceae bacterium]